MTDLAIRRARVDDCATILAFIRELAEYERLLHQVIATEDRLATTLFGPRPAAEVLLASHVAIDGGTPIGFALFFTSYSTFLAKPGLYLEDLFVRPHARGRGIGAALMAACARVAIDRDYGRFEWSVLDWNAPSLAFYASLGAVQLSDWKVHRLIGEPLAKLAARGTSV